MNDVWIRHISPILHRRRGNPQKLLSALERLNVEALRELYRYLSDFEYDLGNAIRTTQLLSKAKVR